jgi:hypothetical protein
MPRPQRVIEKVLEDDPQLRAQVRDLLQRGAVHQDATGTDGDDMQLVIDADSVTFAPPSLAIFCPAACNRWRGWYTS